MKISFRDPSIKRLRVAMRHRDLTGKRLSEKAGIGLSTVEKILAEIIRPGERVAAKIEVALGARVFSSPSIFRRRQLEAQAQSLVQYEVEKGVSEADARAIVASKYSALASSITPTHRK